MMLVKRIKFISHSIVNGSPTIYSSISQIAHEMLYRNNFIRWLYYFSINYCSLYCCLTYYAYVSFSKQ